MQGVKDETENCYCAYFYSLRSVAEEVVNQVDEE